MSGCHCPQPQHPALPDSFYGALDERASSKDEMLEMIVKHPGVDPYRVAGGIVRGIAVDRWLTELLRDGLIEGWESDVMQSEVWCWATEKGKSLVSALATSYRR